MQIPLWQWSVSNLAKAIREKRISSQEVIQSHLDRIDEINQKVNAVTIVLKEEALKAAKEADKNIEMGKKVGKLHGVPFTVKENIDLIGSATTHGIVGLEQNFPQRDAPVISFLKEAGAIPIGRTNMPDFGLRSHTYNDLRGATVNPWDPTRTPGGSSGGESAAIATGMSPLGIGNDAGGSVRYPSQCCGITAVKPSLGRISRISETQDEGFPFMMQVGGVNGPMARHVQDLRLALDTMNQPDPRDPWWSPARQLGSTMPRPIKIALAVSPMGHLGDPQVIEGVKKAADLLSNLGYIIEEIELPSIRHSALINQQLWDAELSCLLPDILPMVSQETKTLFNNGYIGKTKPNLSTYLKATAERHRIAREWNLFFQHYPLILGPVSTLQPFKVGYDIEGPDQLNHFIESMGLTEICNLLGLPSVVVPVQIVDGMPQGVQLIGPRFHEDLCFDAAEAIEQQQGIFTPIDPRDLS